MKEAKLILLTDYRGINVVDDTELRKNLRESNATCTVIKNNITRRALKEIGIESLDEQLEGPTAVIMSNEDYLAASKIIYNFTKDHDFYKIKAGVVDGKVMDSRRNYYSCKITFKRRLTIYACWCITCKYIKSSSSIKRSKKQKEEAGEKVTVSVPC